MVRCWGRLKPGNIELPTDNLPLRPPSTSESISTFPKPEGFRFFGSSRDGWSPARIRAADAECWAHRRAAQQAMIVKSAALARDYEGPEPGATEQDTRIYTKFMDGKYKYWGVQDLDMTMEEFWARNDPDNTRERIANQDSGPLQAPAQLSSSKNPSPRPHTASISKRRRKAPEVNKKYKVAKPAMVTPAGKKGIRKSLAGKIEGRDLGSYEQARDIANSTTKGPTVATNPLGPTWPGKADRSQTISGVNSSTSTPSTMKTAARGRPRKIQPGVVDPSPRKAADWHTSRTENPPKRKRGRPAKEKQPTKSQRSHEPHKKQTRPQAENKAKVTKSRLKKDRLTAPSFHKMRTRARGRVENSQIS